MPRLLLAALMLLTASAAHAQDYPKRPIRVLEPLAAGSAVDVVTRIVADKMARLLGGSLYVDNQPGAAGLLGMRAGAHAAPDGYTLLAVNDSVVTVLPNIRGDAGYDPRTEFAPIVQLVRIHWALVANPALKASTLQEFLAMARAKPGGISFASGGIGSPQHVAMALLEHDAGITLQHVPYRGVTPALNDVVAGQIPVMFAALPTPLPFAADKKLTVLGVADPKPLPLLPGAPAIAQAGVPGFEFYAWGALLAPAGTPPAITAQLNAAANAALADPEVHKQLTDLGYEVAGGTREQLAALIASDFAAKAKLLQDANIHE